MLEERSRITPKLSRLEVRVVKKRVLKTAAIVLCVILAMAITYVLYVVLSSRRLPETMELTAEGMSALPKAKTGETYTIVSQNCGFGAYSPDFTFFMDGGKESWAKSKEAVLENTDAAVREIQTFRPDFVLLQEVDTDSTRSYHVDQVQRIAEQFPGFGQVYAVNYHSAFLLYPFTQPHGASNSGILTLSRYTVAEASRESLEVAKGLSQYLDLDRCFSVSRLPLENGKELVLYNVHTSAYGGSDEIRTSQITEIVQSMEEEYKKGNYCVCGGDFNHDFTGNSTQILNGEVDHDFGWAQPFPAELLPEGISRCLAYGDEQLIPSCRNCDVPYGPDCQTFVVDGYLVSANVTVEELHNIDTGFAYSDHNPVVMRFRLS